MDNKFKEHLAKRNVKAIYESTKRHSKRLREAALNPEKK